jgi:hypothetical protein
MSSVVESRLYDPRTDQGARPHAFVGAEPCATRDAATRVAHALLQCGLWVEVFDAESREVLAGPFDPNQNPPRYVI